MIVRSIYSQSAEPVALGFAGDLSASRQSDIHVRPVGATKAFVSISWTAPAGNVPVGTLVFTLLGKVEDAEGSAAPSTHTSPAGTVSKQHIVVNMFGATAFRADYTRISGGGDWTGYDGTGSPSVTWGA